jgi:hypothetical protein
MLQEDADASISRARAMLKGLDGLKRNPTHPVFYF